MRFRKRESGAPPVDLVGLTLSHRDGATERLDRETARGIAEALDLILFRGIGEADVAGWGVYLGEHGDRIVLDGYEVEFPLVELTRGQAVTLGIGLARAVTTLRAVA